VGKTSNSSLRTSLSGRSDTFTIEALIVWIHLTEVLRGIQEAQTPPERSDYFVIGNRVVGDRSA
jgi:hypothetical protein